MLTGLSGLLVLASVFILICILADPSTSPESTAPAKENESRHHEIEARNQAQDNQEDNDGIVLERYTADPDVLEREHEAVKAAEVSIESERGKWQHQKDLEEQKRSKEQREIDERKRLKEQQLERERQKQAIKDARDDVEITVYVTSWCPVCNKALAYMQANGISFDEYDIEEDPEARKRLGSLNPRRSIPTFVVDGRVKVGFSPKGLEKDIDTAARLRAQKKGW